MSGKRLTAKDLSAANRANDVYNAQVKRGEIDISNRGSTRYVVCGCGVEGCGFISTQTRRSKEEIQAEIK
jgi:hypothetical protein